jgi:hypothetical protein
MKSNPWLVSVAALVAAGCPELTDGFRALAPPAKLRVTVTWPREPSQTHLYALVIAQERVDGGVATLVTAGPEAYDYGDSISLNMDIPNGNNRVVVVEMRPGPSLSEPVLYAGESDTFNLNLTDPAPQSARITMVPVPCHDPVSAAEVCHVSVVGEVGPDRLPHSRTPRVELDLAMGTGTGARGSHGQDFGSASTLGPCAFQDGGVGDAAACWTLRACEPPVSPAGCTRKVYVRFTNAGGYESPTQSAEVVLDTVPPHLAGVDGGVSAENTVEPDRANPGSFLTVRLRAAEPLSALPCLALVPLADGGVLGEVPACDPGAGVFSSAPFTAPTDVFNFRASNRLETLVRSSGMYAVMATLVDVAGNASLGPQEVARFVYDADLPSLSLETVNGVQRDGVPVFGVGEGHNRVVITVRTDVDVEVTAGLEGGSTKLGCTVDPADASRVTCTLNVTEALVPAGREVVGTVWVEARDLAGNTSTARQAVALDNRPPVLTATATARVGQGKRLYYDLGADELLDPVPLPVVMDAQGRVTGITFAVEYASGLRFGWSWDAGEVDGARPDGANFRVVTTCQDLVGNPCDDDGTSFSVDVEPLRLATPALVGFPGAGATPPRHGGGRMDVTVDVLDATPRVTQAKAILQPCDGGEEQAVDCAFAGGTVTCGLEWRPRGGPPCATAVRVLVWDDHGNESSTSAPVILDAEPPGLLTVQVDYALQYRTPLTTLRAAGVPVCLDSSDPCSRESRTEVRLTYGADEELDKDNGIRLTAESASLESVTSWIHGSVSRTMGSFSHVADGSEPPGLLELVFVLRDLAGNEATVRVGCPESGAGSGSPLVTGCLEFLHPCQGVGCRFPLRVDQEHVRFTAHPWGHGSCGAWDCDRAPPACATLGIPDAVEADAFPSRTFLMPEGRGPVLLRVWTRPPDFNPATFDTRGNALLALLECGDDGSCETLRLPNSTQLAVVVTGVDRAGNESMPTGIATSELVSTLSQAEGTRNPHRLLAMGNVVDTMLPPTLVQLTPKPYLAQSVGCGADAAQGNKFWTRPAPSGVTVTPHADFAMAYDVARDRVVVVGGYAGTAEVREWDGLNWQAVVPEGFQPNLRAGARMVYDTFRGRSFYFGGSLVSTGVPQDDAWEWDGANWSQVWRGGGAAPGPEGREGATLIHSTDTGETLVVGGARLAQMRQYNDAWVWNGTTWGEVPPSYPSPGQLAYAAGVYDPVRQRFVLYGGVTMVFIPREPWVEFQTQGQLWEWDGATWTQPTPVGPKPGPLATADMVWDGERNQVVLGPGCSSFRYNAGDDRPTCGTATTSMWTWDGTSWSRPAHLALPPPGVFEPRYFSGMVSIPPRKELLIHAGMEIAYWSTFWVDTWVHRGNEWVERFPFRTIPEPRNFPAASYDTNREFMLSFGGRYNQGWTYSNETWEWDGRAWKSFPPGGNWPSGRDGAFAVYDAARDRTVLYGGRISLCDTCEDDYFGDVWEWDGSSWEMKVPDPETDTPPEGPPPRALHAMAYDEERRVVVLFGGKANTDPAYLDDTWEWDGIAWERRGEGLPGPEARIQTSMAFCPSLHAVVMFSGESSSHGVASHLADFWKYDHTGWNVLMEPGEEWGDNPSPRPPGLPPLPSLSENCTYEGNPAPCPARYTGMATHRGRGSVILWGGQLRSTRPNEMMWEFDGVSWIGFDPELGWPEAQVRPLFYVRRDETVAMYGGNTTEPVRHLWFGDFSEGRRPAFSFVNNLAGLDLDPFTVSAVTVRARAGGSTQSPDGGPGAALLGWNPSEAGLHGGGWEPLVANTTTPTDLENDEHAVGGWLDWTVTGSEAREYLQSADMRMVFQVRPVAGSDETWRDPLVSLDYVEVRVRYGLSP